MSDTYKCLARAFLGITAISCAAEKIGMNFPFPFALEMDGDAAKIFCQCTAHETKPKHIDCRQERVQTSRNRHLMAPVHIDTKLSGAGIFTKLLDRTAFEMARNRTMAEYNCHQDAQTYEICATPRSGLMKIRSRPASAFSRNKRKKGVDKTRR